MSYELNKKCIHMLHYDFYGGLFVRNYKCPSPALLRALKSCIPSRHKDKTNTELLLGQP